MRRMIEGFKVLAWAFFVFLIGVSIILTIEYVGARYPIPTIIVAIILAVGLLSYLIGWGLER